MKNFLVVYESIWNNKFSFKTNKVGDTILEILKDYEVNLGDNVELSQKDIDHLNNEFPYHLYRTNKIGDTILAILKMYNINLGEEAELNIKKLNSENPFEAGTFGPGFYDIDLYDEENEPAGRIMIFYIGEEDVN